MCCAHYKLYHQVNKAYKGKVPSLKSKLHPLNPYTFVAKVPDGTNDLAQSEAKLYLPPGAFIWRANLRGAWYSHYPPHKTHCESWSNHQFDSRQAMFAAVRHVWMQWLGDEGLDESHCPIKGIF